MAKVPPFSELTGTAKNSAMHLGTGDAFTPRDLEYLAWMASGVRLRSARVDHDLYWPA